MLHTKVPHLEGIVEEAVNNASQHNEPQLISVVDQIDTMDPYTFLQASAAIDQHRVFWRSTEEDFFMVGVGSATKMFAGSGDRYSEIELVWNKLRDHAMVYGDHKEKGTGIVALGGFSFDSQQEKLSPWESFPDSQVTVPEFLLTNKGLSSYLTTNVLIFPEDHKQQVMKQLSEQREKLFTPQEEDELPTMTGTVEVDPDQWKESVKKATDDIRRGLLKKVVLARELRVIFREPVQLSAVLRELAQTQPNSYIFAFESEGEYFIGATPERLVKLESQQLTSTCLAGTIPRGETLEEDQRLGEKLLYDPKNRQEHQFVVQMIREAVEACSYNVRIPSMPVLYRLKNLQHLYTPVIATLEQGYTLLDVVRRLHPTPALGGLPQQKSIEYIRRHESLNRGWYAGPIGWFDGKNNGEFAVAIRSALIQNNEASLFAGCGVVEDSDPEAEYEETSMKLKPMLSVLGGS